MAMTTLGDLFATNATAAYEVVTSFMDRDPVTRTPFFESGLLTNNPLVQQAAASSTQIVELPYWGDLDASVEPNYSNDQYQDIAVPQKIATGSLKARNAHLNEGWGVMSLVQELAASDPFERIAARLDTYWRQEAELRLVATLKGLLADNIADNAGDMRVDLAAAAPSANAIIDAQATMGDAFGDIAGVVMHSKLYFAMAKAGLTDETPSATATGLRNRTVMGLPVIVNDKAMTATVATVAKNVAVFLGRDAFAYGMSEPGGVVARGFETSYALEYDREAARGNGGGADTLWSRRNMIVHPLGYDFTSTSITGNGTETVARGAGWTDLANPVNWVRRAGRKQVPISFLLFNA